MQNLNRGIFILSMVGVGISTFLAYEYLQPSPIACPITGGGCETVRKSEYSAVFGISIPYLGILYYLTTASLSILLTQSYQKLLDQLRLALSFAALIFGIYLTSLEAFVIKAWCFWCVASFIVSVLILMLALKSVLVKNILADEN